MHNGNTKVEETAFPPANGPSFAESSRPDPPRQESPGPGATTEPATSAPSGANQPAGGVATRTDQPQPPGNHIDLRNDPEPDFHSLLSAPPPPPPPPPHARPSPTDSHVTLGSLAFRLFDTIESQIARDPHGATIAALSSRVEVVERGLAASASHADALAGLNERIEEIDRQLQAPDPHATAVTALNDRLAAIEHRLAAPHPHSGTIKSLVERMDDVEGKGTPRNISALTERLEMVERHVPSPETIVQMTDRMVALERRLTAPEVVADLQTRVDQLQMRIASVDEPSEKGNTARRVMSLIVFLALIVAAVAVVVVITA